MNFFFTQYEEKLKTLEKEKPDEMEVAEKEAQKGKAQEKGKKS